ncbi:hypothetical protein, partial [Pseudomonas savastanoi]|uniref:hypothetical protein n=1 Tax=Pseudomonas savastanoi TaxID=29438 RepID=UPI0016054B47
MNVEIAPGSWTSTSGKPVSRVNSEYGLFVSVALVDTSLPRRSTTMWVVLPLPGAGATGSPGADRMLRR